MPSLPACNLDNKYSLTFWTVEADPKEAPGASKQRLAKIFKDVSKKCHVAREVSETGYHHHHVCVEFNKPQRIKALIKTVQEHMKFDKPGGTGISVRVFHPRRGSAEDYTNLLSYITDKRFKDSKPDPDGPLEVNTGCPYCKAKKWISNTILYPHRHFACPAHPKYGYRICAAHPVPAICLFL